MLLHPPAAAAATTAVNDLGESKGWLKHRDCLHFRNLSLSGHNVSTCYAPGAFVQQQLMQTLMGARGSAGEQLIQLTVSISVHIQVACNSHTRRLAVMPAVSR
jgi:hypothetical protein